MTSRLRELSELSRARILLFFREPEAIFWAYAFPIILAAVLGFAFRSAGVQPSVVAVVESEGSAELVKLLELDEHLEVEVYERREDAAARLRKTAVDAIVEPGDPPRLHFDPNRVEAETARLRIQRVLTPAAGDAEPPLVLEAVTETGTRYLDFLFPGLIGMNLMGTGMWSIGFAIADVRRRNFLKRLMVTPMRRSSFFLSFMLSRLVFLFAEIVVLAGFGSWILGVPFRGDVVSFSIVTLLGAMTFAGLGVLAAARVRTIEGVSGLMNLVMVPMWLGSGIFFSYERFPEALHPLLRLLPLTGLNDALRSVMIDGESILQQGPEVAVMAAWCAVTFALALKIFRWE